MEVRLLQLFGSLVTTTMAYALARLEFALGHPELPAPPIIERLCAESGAIPHERWSTFETQLEAAQFFLRSHDDRRRKRGVWDETFGRLQRTTRELEQYVRAVRWVTTAGDGR